jgi:lysozyme
MQDITRAVNLIKKWEGLSLKAYLCSAKVWTIGFGSTGAHVKPGMTITLQEAEELLKKDLQRFVNALDKHKLELNNNQYCACISLMFNIGIAAFNNSTLLKKLKAKDYKGAAEGFLKWNKVKGTVLKGLTNRREDERKLFLEPMAAEATIAPVTHTFKAI